MARGQMIPGEEIRYCWLDEDGVQISPTHKNFGAALSYCAEWQEKFDRVMARAEHIRDQMKEEEQANMGGPQGNAVLPPHRASYYEREMAGVMKTRAALTATGKPPVELKRVVVRTTFERPTDIELKLAVQELEKIK